MPQVVSRRIRTILRELLREAEVRRAVQTRHKAVDDGLRDQVEPVDPGQHRGIEESLH
jgi:hypothetical protein